MTSPRQTVIGRGEKDERAGPRGRSESVSHVEVGDGERVCLDKVAARLDEIAHQGRESLLGRVGVADLDLKQTPDLRIECGLPQLLRVHLAQALVALHLDAAA